MRVLTVDKNFRHSQRHILDFMKIQFLTTVVQKNNIYQKCPYTAGFCFSKSSHAISPKPIPLIKRNVLLEFFKLFANPATRLIFLCSSSNIISNVAKSHQTLNFSWFKKELLKICTDFAVFEMILLHRKIHRICKKLIHNHRIFV